MNDMDNSPAVGVKSAGQGGQDLQTQPEAMLTDSSRLNDAGGNALNHLTVPDQPLFDTIPTLRTFYLDLAAAEIPQRDHRGRTIDLHALRLTFGTYLSQAGVPPRVAQAALRHSTIDLTMNIYTDPQLLDVAGAVDTLPDLNFPDVAAPSSGRSQTSVRQ